MEKLLVVIDSAKVALLKNHIDYDKISEDENYIVINRIELAQALLNAEYVTRKSISIDKDKIVEIFNACGHIGYTSERGQFFDFNALIDSITDDIVKIGETSNGGFWGGACSRLQNELKKEINASAACLTDRNLEIKKLEEKLEGSKKLHYKTADAFFVAHEESRQLKIKLNIAKGFDETNDGIIGDLTDRLMKIEAADKLDKRNDIIIELKREVEELNTSIAQLEDEKRQIFARLGNMKIKDEYSTDKIRELHKIIEDLVENKRD